MRVSEEKRREIRKKLIETAVDLISEKGYQGATMRAIARQTGVGDATIYNYFPTKEKILYAYFELRLRETLDEIEGIPDFGEYSLHEKLQALIETSLQRFLPDREFVAEVVYPAYIAPIGKFSEMAGIRKMLTGAVAAYLEDSIQKGEIPDQPFTEFMAGFFWDFHLGIVLYWLKDDSEDFNATSHFTDLCLGFAASVIKSGLIARGVDLVSFWVRNHLYSGMEHLQESMGRFAKGSRYHGGRTDEE